MRVAVVGGGIIGGAIAWRLAQAGMAVDLFDAGIFGGQTSSAGAGMLSPGGEFDRPSVWVDLGVEGMRQYPAFVEELREESGIAIDFQICGCTHYADPEEAERRAAFQSGVGIRVERTPGGLYYPEDGFVDPTDVLRALRAACEARGVNLLEHHPIDSMESKEFSVVVIAAGAWSGGIAVKYGGMPVAIPATQPVKGHLIGFELEPGVLGAMRREGHTYILQRSNGFTIAGSTEEQAPSIAAWIAPFATRFICGSRRFIRLWPMCGLQNAGPDCAPSLKADRISGGWMGRTCGSPTGIFGTAFYWLR